MLLAFTAGVPPASTGPIERDFEAYYAAGATVVAGADPYSRAIWAAESRVPGVDAARDELLPFVGPAAALPLWSLLGRLPYAAALVVWTPLLLAAVAAIVGAGLRLGGGGRSRFRLAGATLLAFAAAPTLSALALGQAALPAAGAVALAILAARGRARALGVAATLVAAIQPNLAFALLGTLRSRAAAAVAGAAALAFAALTFVAGGGWPGFAAYLRRLAAHGAAERFIAIQHTPAAIAFAWGLPAGAATAIGTAIAVAAVVATAVVTIRARLDPTTAALLCCSALPIAIPFFHEQDFVLEVLPLLVLSLRATGGARAAGGAAAALILVDWFGVAQRPAATVQILALGTAASLAYIALGPRRPRRRDLAGLAVLALTAAVALPLGAAHRAPTWPDDLPARFHARAGDDASRVWAGEQRAAGLAAAVPAWGTLRALPLAGCAVLAWALVADARRRRASLQISTPSISSNGVVALGRQPVRSLL